MCCILICDSHNATKPTTLRTISLVNDNLLKERAEPDELCVKYLTLHYVKINATYLIYMQYMATSQISPYLIWLLSNLSYLCFFNS